MTRLLKLDGGVMGEWGCGNIPQGRKILERQTATALTVYRHTEPTPTLCDQCPSQATKAANPTDIHSSLAYEGKLCLCRLTKSHLCGL